MAQNAIANTTAAVNSVAIPVGDKCTFIVTGTLGAAEKIDIEISPDRGSTFSDLYQDGLQTQLSTTNNAVTVYGPGIFRVAKGITSAACGVAYSMPEGL